MKLHRSGATGPYRPEVDGLRAIAVLAVMLFHAGVPWAGGGYLGVDIFFVISGYLIMRLVIGEEAKGRFSLRQFWLRRIRRILPALLVTMALTTPFAVLFMLPDQLQNFGQSLTASALMGNNVLLYLTDGYWSEPTQFKPLMHTWSLGVEEQFYLLLPPFLLLVLRGGGRRALHLLLVVLGVASLALAQYWAGVDDRAAFLLLPARIWELAAGALVALAQRKRRDRSNAPLAVVGLAAMIAAIALFDEAVSAPSLVTAIPVAGCALFLYAADSGRGAGKWLAAPPFVAIGLVSYSAYLLHQPFFAFVRLLSWEEPSPWLLSAIILPVLLLAWASWRWVELPARNRRQVGDRAILLLCGGGVLALAGLGLAMHATNGFASRWAKLGLNQQDNIAYVESAYRFAGASLDPSNKAANLLVVGNSMGRDVINMALEGGRIDPRRIAYVEATQCDEASIGASLDGVATAGTVVIAMTLSPAQFECHSEWRKRLQAAGAGQVLILGPKQFGYSLNRALLLPEDRRPAVRVRPQAVFANINREALGFFPSGSFLDPLALVADAEGRVPLFTPRGELVTQDRRHLTPAGARWLGQKLFQAPQLRHLADQS